MGVYERSRISNKIGAQTFFALRYSSEICGSNGLPLTPNSITILGRSQILKTLQHPNLTKYLDFIRGKHERLIVITEHFDDNIAKPQQQITNISQLTYEIIDGLNYLNQNGLIHRTLSPQNILLDSNGSVKLFNYGLYFMTGCGKDVAFPIGIPKYTAPEVLLLSNESDCNYGPKVDVWSLGIILAELAFKKVFWPQLKLTQLIRKVISLIHCDDVLSRLARESDSLLTYQKMDEDLKDFIELCLIVEPSKRPTPKHLMNHRLFSKIAIDHYCERLNAYVENPLNEWELNELYHLWNLAGGDVESELKKNGLIRNKPPILSIPNLALLEGTWFGHTRDEISMLDLRVVQLPLDNLSNRLHHIPFHSFYPLLQTRSHIIENNEIEDYSVSSLPLIIRERDTEYQFYRLVLYKRLLQAYPYKKSRILYEASNDLPPYYRADIWAVLLGVKGDIDNIYAAVDKETAIATDRQIEVDIPRCHQYNELLCSKSGHLKLKRVLKAWVVSNSQYVYWQGLDSLCAPFLFLNFNHEAKAFACLSAFIPKYLNNFFLKDNSAVIREYLGRFSHLICFHDPMLANHLRKINFVPELFAIPWFLTMFSHVFPLSKIFHLWDKLLLGNSSYPLFVGLTILQQLRDSLLSSGFNECILLFSDLPEVDIERCVTECEEIYVCTPPSITFRRHQQNVENNVYFTEMSEEDMLEYQKEYCPRLCVSDFFNIINNKEQRADVLILDVRPSFQFEEDALIGSINIPLDSIDMTRDECVQGIPPGPELSILMNNRGNMLIVIGNTMKQAAKFSEYLANGGFSKVCTLNGGIKVLRDHNVLKTPSII